MRMPCVPYMGSDLGSALRSRTDRLQMRGRMEDLETLTDLCDNIAGRTVCAFGEAEVAPILSTLKYWRHEYEELIGEAEAANLIKLEPAGARR